MEKTLEEKRAAVLAECERVCPNNEDTFDVTICDLDCTITGRHHHGIADFDIRETGFFKRRIYQIRSSDDGNWWHLYYIFLGLEARDAVEAERAQTAFWERKFNEECEAHINSIEQSESHAAKLVEALECEIDYLSEWRSQLYPDSEQHQDIHEQINKIAMALAAHKKGVQNG